MSWMVQALNPGRSDLLCTHPDQPWGLPSPQYNGYVSFLGLKLPVRGVDQGMALTTHSHLSPRLKKDYRYMSTPFGPSWPLLE